MLRLSRMTDFAVVVLARMAQEGEGVLLTAPWLAQSTGLPGPSVVKVLKALAGHDLVKTHRGAYGGYALARPADAISIREVVTALEGPIALAACVDGYEAQCRMKISCPIGGRWDPVNEAISSALGEVTLADMARVPSPASGAAATL